MKLKYILTAVLGIAITCMLGACGDDDAPARTDASKLVVGTYNGNIVLDEDGSVAATDAVVTLSHLEVEKTQAVELNVKSTSMALNFTGVLNVSKANDYYLLTSASTDTKRGSSTYVVGKIIGSQIVINAKLRQKDGEWAPDGAGSAKAYTITAAKAE